MKIYFNIIYFDPKNLNESPTTKPIIEVYVKKCLIVPFFKVLLKFII